jgi:uncharacterized protein YgbK (DUF1537 family)
VIENGRELGSSVAARVGIIADDLSSATDCGVAFARGGMRTLVPLDPGSVHGGLPRDCEVVSVDTDSRALAPPDAYDAVRGAALAIRDAGFGETVYKSVDSTLRGNLGAEIDAAMDAFGADLAVVAPAFPLYGRTTNAGRHYLRGVPIAQTEIARDPKTPVSESDLVALLGSQSGRRAEKVELKTLRSGREGVLRRVEALVGRGARFAVFDAEEEEDLKRLAETFSDPPCRMVWAGSTGLARHLPGVLAPVRAAEKASPETRSGVGPALLVAGSVSEVTRGQILTLERLSGVARVELDPVALVGEVGVAEAEERRCQRATAQALDGGRSVALSLTPSTGARLAVRDATVGGSSGPRDVSARIASALGSIAAGVAAERNLAGMVLTGGDTAKAACLALGAVGLELLDEVEPGVPLGRLVVKGSGRHAGLAVVTKAGAFGDGEMLVRAFRALIGGS